MTRRGRIFLDPCLKGLTGGLYAPFLSILCNNVQIYGKAAEDVPPTFIVKTLVERGGIAYLRAADTWAAFVPDGRRKRTGFPTSVRLIGDGGQLSEPMWTEEGAGSNLCLIPANPYFYPPAESVKGKVALLDEITNSLTQNLAALKQSTAIIYDDPALTTEIEAAEGQRLAGATTVKIKKNLGGELDIRNFSPEAKSHIPDLIALWTQTVEEIDEMTGRATVGEKTERRTDDEISVIEQSASATIDVIIDTFNRYAKWYDIPARAVRGVEIRENKKTAQDGEHTDSEQNEPQNGNEGATDG